MFKLLPITLAIIFLNGCAVNEMVQQQHNENQRIVGATAGNALSVVSAGTQGVQQPNVNQNIHSNFLRVNRNWVSTTPIPVQSSPVVLPDLFQRRVSITMPGQHSLPEVVSELRRATGVHFNLAKEIHNTTRGLATIVAAENTVENIEQSPMLITDFIFRGTLKESLNALSTKANISWRWQNNTIHLFRYETKTYHIAALIGTTNINSNVQLSSAGGSQGDTEGAARSGVTREAEFTTWDEIRNFLVSQMSPTGKIAVLEGTGVVAITDTPQVHNQIKPTIKEINRLMTKQVFMKVNIFSLSQSDSDNLGIDWNLAWSGNNVDNSNRNRISFDFTPLPVAGAGSFNIGVLSGPFAGTSVMLNALSNIGRVSLIDQYTITTLSGQPAPIASNRTFGYLARTNVTLVDGTPSVELEPGSVVTGVNMNLLPRVSPNGNILLEYSINMNNLISIRAFNANGSGIELPDMATKSIANRAVLRNGQTLVLSGFKRQQTSLNNSGVINPNNFLLGGNRQAGMENEYLIITVTPHIAQNRTQIRR